MPFAGLMSSRGDDNEVFAKRVLVSDDEQTAFVVCSVMPAPRFDVRADCHSFRVGVSAEDATTGEDQMATEENPGRVPSRILFTALICAGYVYVAFWIGFMIEGAFGHNG